MRTAARLLQVRPSEVRLAALAAAMFAAIQAGQGFGANTADALLFRRFGVDSLPVMFMILGGATFVVTLAYSAALSRAEPGRLSVGLLVAAATALVAARAATTFSGAGLYPVLWLLVGLTGALLGTLVWNVAGDLFDARQSKRLFPLFTSAGILGGVAGNLSTGRLAQVVGTENLLLFDAALLGLAALAVRSLRPDRREAGPRPGPTASVAAQLRAGHDYVMRSRLMRLTAVAGILFSILFFSISYPFSRAVSDAFPDEAQLAGYLGGFSGIVTVVTFVVSSLLAGRLYAWIGVVNSVLILPVVYLAGFALWMVRFDLGTAAAVRFAQLTILGGLAGTAYSALFNVVPADKRSLVRAYQAGVPAQLGVVLSGGLLWLGQRGLDERSLFAVGIVVALACGYLVLQTRRAYGQSLVDSLKSGLVDVFTGAPRDLRGLAADAQARAAAAAGLRDERPAVRRIAAEVLGKMQAREFAVALAAACRDSDPNVRRAATRALGHIGAASSADVLRVCLRDSDPGVRAESVRVLASLEEISQEAFLDLLEDPHPAVRSEAAAAILQRGENPKAAQALELLMGSSEAEDQLAGTRAFARLARAEDGARLERALSTGSRPIRLAAIEGLGARRDPLGARLLLETMDDDDSFARRAAARKYGASEFDPAPLIEALAHGSDRLQESALEALAGKGNTARGPVIEWTLGQIPKAQAQRRMAAGLNAPGGQTPAPAVDYLRTMLEREEWRLEQRVLTALSLLGGAEAMPYVARALRSFDPGLRSQALEALDTLGEKRITRALLPLLESPDDAGEKTDRAAVLRQLMDHPRAWVRALALWALAQAVERERHEWLRRRDDDRDPVVRVLLERLPAGWTAVDGGSKMDTSATLTTMERVLFLRQVPLFAQLDPEDLQQIAEISVERMYEPGDVLVREGDLGDELFVIVEGAVRVGKQSEAGERWLRRLGPGDHLGELAILREQPRSASAVADGERVRALALKGQALTAILDERPSVSRAMLSSLAERLSTLA